MWSGKELKGMKIVQNVTFTALEVHKNRDS